MPSDCASAQDHLDPCIPELFHRFGTFRQERLLQGKESLQRKLAIQTSQIGDAAAGRKGSGDGGKLIAAPHLLLGKGEDLLSVDCGEDAGSAALVSIVGAKTQHLLGVAPHDEQPLIGVSDQREIAVERIEGRIIPSAMLHQPIVVGKLGIPDP